MIRRSLYIIGAGAILSLSLLSARAQAVGDCSIAPQSSADVLIADQDVLAMWNCDSGIRERFWSDFGFNGGEWSKAFAPNWASCDVNQPVWRVMNAMYVLGFSFTPRGGSNSFAFNQTSPNKALTPIAWAYPFVKNAINDLRPSCNTGKRGEILATVVHEHVEIARSFMEELHPVGRAATLFHEARHMDAWPSCTHDINSSCIAGRLNGGNPCDSRFEDDCANAYTVKFFASYMVHSNGPQAWKDYARDQGRSYLRRRFNNTPDYYMPGDGPWVDVRCGDGKCEGAETNATCARDCKPPPCGPVDPDLRRPDCLD